MAEEIFMIEKDTKIGHFKWTVGRFEILRNDIDIKNIVNNFVDPVVQSIRRENNRLAERWYWSWSKQPNTNLFCRIY